MDHAWIRERVLDALQAKSALRLVGHDSKGFYGNLVEGDVLDLAAHAGIVDYEPTELVLTARCGTPLQAIVDLLAEHGQQLSFDPPRFDDRGTLGGCIASGLGGPARPWGGAPRDALLGVQLLDGNAQVLRFGGRVMKNVAGYDVSRLMAGALGTLGILLEVSIKVLPGRAVSQTVVLGMNRQDALQQMRDLCRQPLPLDGACFYEGLLYLRLSGNESSVNAWRQRLGGELLEQQSSFWQRLRDQQLEFFTKQDTLWRLSLPPATATLECERNGSCLIDWGGAQRWLFSASAPESIRGEAQDAGGHAEIFRRGDGEPAQFQQLSPALLALHKRLKTRFDPQGIFNPGRLFDD